MDAFLTFLALVFLIAGFIGTFLPVLPGPPVGWLGIVCVYGTNAVPNNTVVFWGTLGAALLVTALDYVIPVLGTKKFGGSKKGVWGATLGMFIGLFFGPLGIVFGPFIGAFIGEMFNDSEDSHKAFKAAWGSFLGFLLSTGLKLIVSFYFIYQYIVLVWEYKSAIFSW